MEKNPEQHIDEILTRGVSQIIPRKEELRKLLLSGKKLRIFTGADATGPQLHIGHATNFILLEKLRKLGHEVVILLGDFTAMIGDPTDKSAARIKLTKEQVDGNIRSWKEQVSKLVDFDDPVNPAKIVKNSEWLSKLNFADVVEIASNFTVQQMLERDMFEKRMKEAKPIHLHEFFYPLMQGYDSVYLDVDLEIGGNDQMFNMLAGRTLQKKYHNKEKFVLTTTLLVNPVTGEKLMSKSLSGFVALDDKPNDMFGKIMALPDETIAQIFIDCTHVPMAEISKLGKEMKDGTLNPRDAKLRLAGEIVAIYHGEEAARAARQYFIDTFSKKEIPQDISQFEIEGDSMKLTELLVKSGNAMSMSDARRKIEQGGVSAGEEKITDSQAAITRERDGQVLKVGKMGFVRIMFKNKL